MKYVEKGLAGTFVCPQVSQDRDGHRERALGACPGVFFFLFTNQFGKQVSFTFDSLLTFFKKS